MCNSNTKICKNRLSLPKTQASHNVNVCVNALKGLESGDTHGVITLTSREGRLGRKMGIVLTFYTVIYALVVY